MKVFIEKERKQKTVSFSGNVKGLLVKLRVNPENVIVVKNGEIVQEDEILEDNDEIKLLSVISGG